jgi:hypothetical protein
VLILGLAKPPKFSGSRSVEWTSQSTLVSANMTPVQSVTDSRTMNLYDDMVDPIGAVTQILSTSPEEKQSLRFILA